ncbi:MAG: UbiX family flavin prenyltransferase [Thermoplasmatales archaeon]|nr:UbiX family flavin prenyltransferase [Thermoplasmatales archaeon]
MKFVIAITGASGVIYGIRLVEELKKKGNFIYLIISDTAKKIIGEETQYRIQEIEKKADRTYNENDINAEIASGSAEYDAMVICPCSGKTLSAIANGLAINLIIRSAICCLKEGRKLILVPRETPLDAISLENMLKLSRTGVTILPAMPAFYIKPKSVDDMINFITGKVMDQLGIKNDLYKRWK